MWKCATRKVVLWILAGAIANKKPVIPPMRNVTIKPSVNSIGTENRTRPRYIVSSQPKIVTSGGTAAGGAADQKKAAAPGPAPREKKWRSQTNNNTKGNAAVAKTSDA